MKLVKIIWEDAIGADGWISRKELEKETPIIHTTVGYVVIDKPEYITITMSYDEKEINLGAWMVIPRKYIKKIIKL